MARFIKKVNQCRQTPVGQVVEALLYAAMLTLVLIYFTGNGQFIYEGL